MKRYTVVLFFPVIAALFLFPTLSYSQSFCQSISIPAYFYPGPLWEKVINGRPSVNTVIMNPENGPGQIKNPDYVEAIKNAQRTGISVIGYIHTDYGNRNVNLVKSEIDKYISWYDVNGIFLDEVSTDPNQIPYYNELYNYIHSYWDMIAVLNPGTFPHESYMKVGDILLVFEGNYWSYFRLEIPSWVFTYDPGRFWHVIYDIRTKFFMKNVVRLSRNRNAGNVYVTNDKGDNPYDTLPSYWDDELNEIERYCLHVPKIHITYSDSNYDYFKTVADEGDRLHFWNYLLQNPNIWPQKAQDLQTGDVVVSWPSWRLSQDYEALWAPYADVFGYDIEYDTPPDEWGDLPQTIIDLKDYLMDLAEQYENKIKLSCGLNYQFGTDHTVELSHCGEVHIHANQLLRIYPEADSKGQNYVEWALTRAEEVKAGNPKVKIWFSSFVPEVTVNQSTDIIQALCQGMKDRQMGFEGFTFWGEKSEIEPIVSQIKDGTLCTWNE